MCYRNIIKKCTPLLKNRTPHYSYGRYIEKNRIRNKKKRLDAIIYFLQHTR